MAPASPLLKRRLATGVAVGAVLCASLLAWLGYIAIREWQRSVARLAEREAEEASELLFASLTRDMRAVQRSVLSSPALDAFTLRPPYEAINFVTSAFARYQYPESFFLWRHDNPNQSTMFLERRDRPPVWAHRVVQDPNRFPVKVGNDPDIARVLLERIRIDAAQARRFSVFETELSGAPYQVVARLFYSDRFHQDLDAILGFTVNLEWVRAHYFSSVLEETQWEHHARGDVELTILDERGQTVSGAAAVAGRSATYRRAIPLMFFNPLLVAADPPADLQRATWVVQATAREDSSLVAALRAGNRMLILQAMAAGALAFGLLMTLRASRASLELAELRSEFVSSVTHEFKTPIATIQAAGETLASGRIEGAGGREYAAFIVHEAGRLTRLVDNLLTFSRVTDTAGVPRDCRPVALAELVNDRLGPFALHLADGKFAVQVDVPATLPPVAGDASAIGLMLDNLIDNVIRHSRTEHQLRIAGSARDGRVILDIADRGGGIAEDELQHVTRKFYRGRHAGHGGTGLGLAIASRIVADHGGTLNIRSDAGVGTTVTVSLPAARAAAASTSPAA
jgi:signal transduction histidine kinase